MSFCIGYCRSISILTAITLFGIEHCRSAPMPHRHAHSETLAHIRSQCRYIDRNLKRDKKRDQDLETGTDGGGGITGYFYHGRLVKMIFFLGLSNHNEEDSFYFNARGHLIEAVNRQLNFYMEPKTQYLNTSKYGKVGQVNYYYLVGNSPGVIARGTLEQQNNVKRTRQEAARLLTEPSQLKGILLKHSRSHNKNEPLVSYE